MASAAFETAASAVCVATAGEAEGGEKSIGGQTAYGDGREGRQGSKSSSTAFGECSCRDFVSGAGNFFCTVPSKFLLKDPGSGRG